MAGPARIVLEHIAIAVPRLEEALAALEKALRVKASPPEEVATEGVRLAFLEAGDARLEVLEPTRADSPVARFLARGQSGVHHLAFRVEGMDLAAFGEELKREGLEILGRGPRPGAHGTEVLFLHPRSTAGLLVEFCQKAGAGAHEARDVKEEA